MMDGTNVAECLQIKEDAISNYFDRVRGLWLCKRHQWQDADGGLCPSCAMYAMNAAVIEAFERGKNAKQ